MVFASIAREIGRQLRGALPFAIVKNTGGGVVQSMLCHRTIQSAADAGHQFIFVAPGTYNENVTISNADVTLFGCGSASVVDGGATVAPVISVTGARCRVINLKATHTAAHSAVKVEGADCVVMLCEVTSPASQGIITEGAGGTDPLFVFNRVYDCISIGIGTSGSLGGIVLGNFTKDNGYGVFVNSGGGEVAIVGNRVLDEQYFGIYMPNYASVDSCAVVGNVCMGDGAGEGLRTGGGHNHDNLIVGNRSGGWANNLNDQGVSTTVASNETG